MRSRRRLTALIVVLAATAACSLRILPKDSPLPPAAAVDRHVLCAAVAVKDDWARPGPDGTSFVKGRDAAVHSFLELRDLRGRHAVAWKWYDPARSLVRASDPVAIGEEGKTYDRYIAWDRILLDADREAGRWTVAVFIDGALADSRVFEIR
jgi:hypothetical protein